MFQNEYELKVDIKRKFTAVVPTFVQNDTATLVFRIYDDGKPFDLSSFTKAEVATERKDGTLVIGVAHIEGSGSNQYIRYNYMGNEMSKAGFAQTTLTLFSDTTRVSILPFQINIVADIRDAIGASEEFGILQEMVVRVESVLENIGSVVDSANQAVEIANSAAIEATNAVGNANLAITNAQIAATSAEEKALVADNAANNANAKAELAMNNALLAEESATNANSAVLGIDEAINNANLATTNANDAANNANTATANVNDAIQASELATQNASAATTNAINAKDQALSVVAETLEAKDATVLATNNANIATTNANKATDDLTKIKNDAIAATFNANTSATNANVVIGRANTSANNAQSVADNTASHGAFVLGKSYKKNNLVLDNGSTWIALSDTQNNPLPTLPVTENTWWRLVAQRGVDGTGSVVSVNDVFPDVNGNVVIDLGNAITKVDGFAPDSNGNVSTHDNKPVLDALTDDAGQLKYNGSPVGSVTSVNGQTGDVTVKGFSGSYNDLTEVPTEFNPSEHSISKVTGLQTSLDKKVDKVTGKGLSTNDYTSAEKTKLQNIQENANNYIHPTNHPASIITQDANNRFVSDTQISSWNAKETTTGSQAKATQALNDAKAHSDTHANSKENPHQVTASQVGAYTTAQTDAKITNEIGILSDDVGLDTTTLTTNAKKVVAAINEINAKPTGGDTTEIAKQINTLYNLSTGIIREQAYTKLLQDASDRIDGGTVFAHDMNGNIIGMTLDEANSQNIVIRDGKMMMINRTFNTQTRTDTTVAASAYDTSGNGGRKLVRLSNGWLVAVTMDSVTGLKFYVSKDNGATWSTITGGISASGIGSLSCSIESKGTMVYVMLTGSTFGVVPFHTFNALTIGTGATTFSKNIDTSQTGVSSCSLAINPEGTELHAAWSSKNATYPSSFNIRYAKGVISQVDGSVTWGTVEQVTTANNSNGTDYKNPCLTLNSNNEPVLSYEYTNGSNGFKLIHINIKSSGSWTQYTVFQVASYLQSSSSMIFVPKSINGLANGLIAIVWHGYDATHPSTFYIRFSKSIDNGVNWSTMQKIVSGQNASITYDKYGNLYIEYERGGNTYYIKSSNNGDSWGTETLKGVGANPSTLLDSSLDITKPLSIRKGTSSVVFNGEWKETVETQSLTAKAVYNIPTTDYVGTFVKKIGATNVQAYVNDTLMDTELVDNEYGFTKQLPTESPVKLRLELSRTSTSGGESDAVVRVLGGRS